MHLGPAIYSHASRSPALTRPASKFTEWSAIVVSLPGVSHWSPAHRRGLLDVIKARGGRTERAYVEALQRAHWVVDALAALAKGKRPVS